MQWLCPVCESCSPPKARIWQFAVVLHRRRPTAGVNWAESAATPGGAACLYLLHREHLQLRFAGVERVADQEPRPSKAWILPIFEVGRKMSPESYPLHPSRPADSCAARYALRSKPLLTWERVPL